MVGSIWAKVMVYVTRGTAGGDDFLRTGASDGVVGFERVGDI